LGHPFGCPGFYLAAAAAIVVAAATVRSAVVTAAAEQQNQDDDPPAVIPTKAIVTHNEYLRFYWSSFAAHSKIFHSIKKVQIQKDQLM